MLECSVYKNIVSNLSESVVLVKPLYVEENIRDFSILYFNKQFEKILSNVKENDELSVLTRELSSEVDFVFFCKIAFLSSENSNRVFFSKNHNIWLRANFTKIQDDILMITFQDVSKFMEKEDLLKKQNERLASISEELFMSKQSLRIELDKIENLNKELEHLAYYDKLTEIPNRVKMMHDLEIMIKNASENDVKAGIMVIDVDNLKKVNDSLGHSAGDELLQRTANILSTICNNDISVYRFGGDEFLLAVNNAYSKDFMCTVGDIVLEELNKVNIQISAGIAMYPADSTKLDELFQYADMAMYEVKKTGKNSFSFFHQVMQKKFVERICLENKLTNAIDTSCLELYFQPQVDITTMRLRGFEALIRWYDEELGWIHPEQFIPMAEESKLIIPLGDWVLDQSCYYLSKWQREYDFQGIMSVNVSPIQLKNPTFLFDLSSAIRRYRIDPRKIEIEITEGIFIDNIDDTVALLTRIKELGVGISLDDFGTGYSSLSYLQVLPLTTLKIDKSFIANIASEESKEADITNAIVSLVSKMGLDTIAEGVENPEQLKVLEAINCKNTQGFLMGKPMPATLCERMLDGDETAVLRPENCTGELLYKI